MLQQDELAVLHAGGGAPEVHYFDTFFFNKLKASYADNSTNVHRNTTVKKIRYSILDCKKWVVPINQVTFGFHRLLSYDLPMLIQQC